MNKATLTLLFIFLFGTSFKQPPIHGKGRKVPAKIIVDKTVRGRIDATLKSFVDSGKIAGVSALVFENNKEVYFNSFGYSKQEEKTAMDRNTIVRIYSMTKPVTGVALMRLYEKGAFQLDDPLSKYAPEFANMTVYKGVDGSGKMMVEPAKRPITIRDITRHTAGFAVATDLPVLSDLVKEADASNPRNTLSEMAKKLARLPLQFHPGDQWAYGPSVDVQAYLVELISKKPFDQYLKENIFEAHRLHFYQILSNEYKVQHRFVALIYAIVQSLISISVIFLYQKIDTLTLFFIIILPLVLIYSLKFYMIKKANLKIS